MHWVGLTVVAALAAGAAQGQAAPSAPPPAAPAEGVTRYPASFFADARPNTAFDMIARLPGFTFDGGAQVRGFAGAAGNVIIDGQRPTTKQDDLEAVLRRIPASQVERIDVIRGGAPGVDMHGRTILANVIRKKNGGTQVVVTSVVDNKPDDGRTEPTVRVEASRRENGTALEGSVQYANFFDDGPGPGPHTQIDNPAVPGSGVCQPICTAHLGARAGGRLYNVTGAYETPLAGGDFRVNGLVSGLNYLDREADSGAPTAFDDLSRNTQDQYSGELGAHYTHNLGKDMSYELLAIQQGQRRLAVSDYTQGDFEHFREADTLTESILRGIVHDQFSKTLTLETSVEGAYNVQDTGTYYTIDGVPQGLTAANVHITETRGEAAGSATWTPSPLYTLEAGLKVEASTIASTGDVVQEKTLIYPKPRAVFTWSPDAKDQVRLRLERQVGQLDFGAFVASSALNTTNTVHVGNPNLLPQDVWVSELALERKFWGKGDLTLTLRHSDIADAVDRVPDPTGEFDEPGNIGHATEDELVVDATAPLDKLFIANGLLKFTGTWRETRATDPTTHAERPLTQIHPFDGELHFSQDLNRLKSTWGVNISYGFRETYYRYDEIDVYKLGDQVQMFYEYKPTAKLSLRFEANNVTSRPSEQTYTVFSGPRPAPVESVDWRNERSGLELHLRLRRTFG
jgi:outer membrane receptor protein involved in Fe transport